MNAEFLDITLIVGAYFIGSIPFGFVLSKLFAKIDIRDHGSRNIGATNVYRTLGNKLGALTLLADILKGFFPVWLAGALTSSEALVCATALAAFFGHLYPIYLKFSGGKGVATAVGVYFALAPWALLFGFVAFVLVLFAFRYVSLSSIAGAIAISLFMILSPVAYPRISVASAAIIAVMIVYRHKDNIRRLQTGQESRIGKRTEG